MTISSPWPSQAPYPKQHASEWLRQVAEQQPDRTALIGPDERFHSFGEVWDASRRIARMLQEDAGVRKGEVVAIFAANSPEYVVAITAFCWRAASLPPSTRCSNSGSSCTSSAIPAPWPSSACASSYLWWVW